MQPLQIITIILAVLVVAAVAYWVYERNRARQLRNRFGSEYDRRVAQADDRREAESELARSEERVRNLKARPLSDADRARFIEEWRQCQKRFVDDPAAAVEGADRTVTEIMRVRGASVDDPYDRVSDICAAYPEHAADYREASDIIIRHHRGLASTDELRQAFVNFRSLFDEMVSEEEQLKRAS
jgi:hypothetical protein